MLPVEAEDAAGAGADDESELVSTGATMVVDAAGDEDEPDPELPEPDASAADTPPVCEDELLPDELEELPDEEPEELPGVEPEEDEPAEESDKDEPDEELPGMLVLPVMAGVVPLQVCATALAGPL